MNLLHELKFALRSRSRAKGLAITVVLTLALGIGANASIFSVVRGVLLRPLVQLPGVWPVLASAAELLVAAVIGSLLPAARTARVDVVQALRAEQRMASRPSLDESAIS